MICGNCCNYIKLKCLFYFQKITSNTIYKKEEQMIDNCTPRKKYKQYFYHR